MYLPRRSSAYFTGVSVVVSVIAFGLTSTTHAGAAASHRQVRGDFNRDGYADLAVAAPNANGGAGAVIVLFGSTSGLTTSGSEYWTLGMPGVAGPRHAAPGDDFGRALAVGDFNGDGVADLAIGVPGKSGVLVLYGSRTGLHASASQWLPGEGLLSGSSLAAGDLNGDREDDLAVGAPFASVHGVAGAGSLEIHYGSAGGLTGVTRGTAQRFTEATQGMPGATAPVISDNFAASLTVGHFRGDRFADLAIGIPSSDTVGAVDVLYGSRVGVTVAGAQYVQGISRFGLAGFAVAAGDFNGDGFDDLAIASPDAVYGNTGAIEIHNGSATGLGKVSPGTARSFAEVSPGMPGPAPAPNDQFGYTMTIADLNDDGFTDLVVGVAGKSSSIVLYGSRKGITTRSSQYLAGVGPQAGGGSFTLAAVALCAGDYNGDGYSDVVLGEPFADTTQTAAGVVEEHAGSATGVLDVVQDSAPLFSESTAGMPGPPPQPEDNFGITVTSAGVSH